MDLKPYLDSVYVDGGRGRGQYDCWGLVRDVLHNEFNCPLYKSFGHVEPDDKTLLTESAQAIMSQFSFSKFPESGTLACGYIGKRMVHIGVCVIADDRLKVLHAHRKGIRLNTVREFGKVAGSRVLYFKPIEVAQC